MLLPHELQGHDNENHLSICVRSSHHGVLSFLMGVDDKSSKCQCLLKPFDRSLCVKPKEIFFRVSERFLDAGLNSNPSGDFVAEAPINVAPPHTPSNAGIKKGKVIVVFLNTGESCSFHKHAQS